MDFDFGPENYEAKATPKLSLHKLPSKQKQHHVVMFTPPNNNASASIPFHWEEAPGKPRPNFATNNSVARRLDLPHPPRLLNSITTTNHHIVSSPATVLDGPYGGSAFSLPEKGSFIMSLEDQLLREVKYKNHGTKKRDVMVEEKYGSLNFGSWTRGESYNTGRLYGDSFDFTHSVTTPLASKSHSCAEPKPPRSLKRSSTYSSVSQATSNLFAGMYGSLKRVVHWRRKQEQKKA